MLGPLTGLTLWLDQPNLQLGHCNTEIYNTSTSQALVLYMYKLPLGFLWQKAECKSNNRYYSMPAKPDKTEGCVNSKWSLYCSTTMHFWLAKDHMYNPGIAQWQQPSATSHHRLHLAKSIVMRPSLLVSMCILMYITKLTSLSQEPLHQMGERRYTGAQLHGSAQQLCQLHRGTRDDCRLHATSCLHTWQLESSLQKHQQL